MSVMLNAETLAQIIGEHISDHPMWQGIDYTMTRERLISEFCYETAEAILASPEWAEHEREVAAKALQPLRDYCEHRGRSGYYDAMWRKGEILTHLNALADGKSYDEAVGNQPYGTTP